MSFLQEKKLNRNNNWVHYQLDFSAFITQMRNVLTLSDILGQTFSSVDISMYARLTVTCLFTLKLSIHSHKPIQSHFRVTGMHPATVG